LASERQIAANRRNARSSTGPRSDGGKKRARHNSYRHGFTAGVASNAELAKAVERLAREIAGDTADAITLEYSRAAAQAEFDLARIRQVKVALIQRMSAFGAFEAPLAVLSLRQIIRFIKAFERDLPIPAPVEAAETLPSSEPARSAEAVRRALPELLKLDRYERRATVRRGRAIRGLVDRIKF